VKFWFIDAKAFSPFPVLLIVKSLTILAIGVIFLVFFFILEKKGLGFTNFLRKIRTQITGSTKAVRKLT